MRNGSEKKETLIFLKGIKKKYKRGKVVTEALRGVDLDIYKGELLVILGKSGCGKSTLLNIIGGIDTLDEGDFNFEGNDHTNLKEKARTAFRRDNIGFIFQDYNLMPELNVKENVEFISSLCKNAFKPKEILERVGLEKHMKKYPSQLSGGEAQRVSIARALVKKPKLVLADEPTAALDYSTSIDVLDVIQDIKNQGTTVVMVTHNEEIAKMADRIVKMKDGVVTEIIQNDNILKANELVW